MNKVTALSGEYVQQWLSDLGWYGTLSGDTIRNFVGVNPQKSQTCAGEMKRWTDHMAYVRGIEVSHNQWSDQYSFRRMFPSNHQEYIAEFDRQHRIQELNRIAEKWKKEMEWLDKFNQDIRRQKSFMMVRKLKSLKTKK